MEISGSSILPISRHEVWHSLYDEKIIKGAIKGCTDLEWTSDCELTGKIKTKFGPVKAAFDIDLQVSEPVEFESYKMTGTTKVGPIGYVSGLVKFRLEDAENESCEIFYDAELSMGGKVAQIGSRLMHSAANKMIDDFFKAFVAGIVGEEGEEEQTNRNES